MPDNFPAIIRLLSVFVCVSPHRDGFQSHRCILDPDSVLALLTGFEPVWPTFDS